MLTDGWTEDDLAEVLKQFQPRVVEDYFVHVPHPVQQVALSLNSEELLFGGAVGGGKALALDTPIKTYDGWSTMGDIAVGDYVHDQWGMITEVVWKSEVMHNRPTYELWFSDGAKIVADEGHKWVVRKVGSRSKGFITLTTGDIFDQMQNTTRTKFSVDVTKPLWYPAQELDVDPYVFGYWLGDGDTRRGYVTVGDEDIEATTDNFSKCGYTLDRLAPMHYRVNGLTKQLIKQGTVGPQKIAGVKQTPRPKRIPSQYMNGSTSQRLAVLQGLVDSDGYVDDDIELTTNNMSLAEDYLDLVLSLGIKATIMVGDAVLNGIRVGPKYRIKFLTHLPCARLPRKLAKQKTEGFRGTHDKRYIVSVKKVASVPVQCIAVNSPEHMYLAGRELIPTHNSDYALMCALQYVDVPGYAALILRRTWPDLNAPGAILERFATWMAPHIKNKTVKKQEGGRTWKFPSGAIIQFGYVNRAPSKTKFQGAEYQTIIFDEATLFESEVYEYLRSRLRRPSVPCGVCTAKLTRYVDGEGEVRFKHSKAGGACATPLPDPRAIAQYTAAKDGLTVFDIPLRLRATANPGGISHQFFKERFIDEETRNPEAIFIPSTLNDNPSLDREEYAKTLEHLSPVDKERMLNGDWEVMDEGNLFNRGDFEFVDEVPRPAEIKSRVRYWDFAASDGQQSDYTVGALCSVTHDGRWFIEDLRRVKYLPPQVEKLVRKTAEQDGIGIKIYAEQEPGSAGKSMMSHFKRRVLAGYHFEGIRSTGTKTARANALVSQTEAHNVYIKKASWGQALLDEASTFPLGQHDDQIDAISGAFNAMTTMKKPVRLVTSSR